MFKKKVKLFLADVGGTSIKWSMVDGRASFPQREPIREYSPDALLDQVAGLASEADAMALALPGTVRPGGEWKDSVAYGLLGQSMHVRQELRRRGAPELRALCQDVFAAGRGMGILYPEINRIAVLNIGSGLGGSIVVGGWPWSGLAQEIGHIQLPGKTEPCACGGSGCLETFSGWRALSGRFPELTSAQEFREKSNEPQYEEAFRDAIDAVSFSAAIIDASFNPDAVFLLGGTARALFSGNGIAALRKRAREMSMREPEILLGPGPEVPLAGLASLSEMRLELGDFEIA